MCETVRPTSLAMSLKTGTGGKLLRSFLALGAPLAVGGTGTGTRCGPWACAARTRGVTVLKIRKQSRTTMDPDGYRSMRDDFSTNEFLLRSKPRWRFSPHWSCNSSHTARTTPFVISTEPHSYETRCGSLGVSQQAAT